MPSSHQKETAQISSRVLHWRLAIMEIRSGLHSLFKQLATSWPAALRSWLALSLFNLSAAYFLRQRILLVWELSNSFTLEGAGHRPASPVSPTKTYFNIDSPVGPSSHFVGMAHFGLSDVRTCLAMSLRRVSLAESVRTSDRGHANGSSAREKRRMATQL